MISEEILAILRCPENHTPLSWAEDALVARLNEAAADGRLTNRGGEKVEANLESGLIREDKAYLYPVIDGIPVLLIDEAIAVSDIGEQGSSAP